MATLITAREEVRSRDVSASELRLRQLSFAVLAASLAGCALLIRSHAPYALCFLAVLLGWTQLIGVCGKAHLGSLGPLSQVRSARTRWLVGLALYTIAGSLTGGLVGAALGKLGEILLPNGHATAKLAVILLALGLALCRELNWVSWPLPDAKKQTRPDLARRVSFPVAAAVWGLHLGLVYATWLTVPGPLVLGLIAIASRSPGFAASLFVFHWIGRTLPVWSAPLLLKDSTSPPVLIKVVHTQHHLLRALHLLGLVCAAAVLFVHFFTVGGFL